MNKVLFIFIFIAVVLVSCNEKPVQTMVTPKVAEKVIENHFVLPEVPKKMIFAGEKIPLDDIDLKERMDNELVINNFWHSNTIMMMKRANRWMPQIREVFRSEQVPLDLVYIAIIESGLQNVTSPRGAKGFWQFMEDTGREYELKINRQVDERYHVEKSTRAACLYLKKAYERFDSWVLAAASYNLGMFGIADNLERQQVDSFFDLSLNPETARYVFRIMAVKLVFENPEKYGFYIEKEDLYPPYITQDVKIDSTVSNLYEWSVEQGISIKILRKLNPWIRGRSFVVSSGEEFTFKIPKNDEQLGRFKG